MTFYPDWNCVHPEHKWKILRKQKGFTFWALYSSVGGVMFGNKNSHYLLQPKNNPKSNIAKGSTLDSQVLPQHSQHSRSNTAGHFQASHPATWCLRIISLDGLVHQWAG
jgi:hypothetical protein